MQAGAKPLSMQYMAKMKQGEESEEALKHA